MKTRRTRASGARAVEVEGDQSLIGFRRSRSRTGTSSNASASGGGEDSNKNSSPSSQQPTTTRRITRRSSGRSSAAEEEPKADKSPSSAAPSRRSTRSSRRGGGDGGSLKNVESDTPPPPARASSRGKASKKNSSSAAAATTKAKSSGASKSSGKEKDSPNNEKSLGKEDHEDDDAKPPAHDKEIFQAEDADNDDASHHPPPPVKEITTTTTTSTATKKKRGDGPKYLDDATMKLVYDYIIEYKGDFLDEDEVIAFMSRMHRIANQQAKYQMALVSGTAARHHNLDSDQSECGSDDTSVFIDCMVEEEEHAVGHEMFKRLVANIQLQHSRNNGDSKHGGSLTKKVNKLLDKKTLMWIKRAAGLHRTDPGKMLIQKQADGKGGRMSTRRYTRKQALDRRGQKKERERGLDIMGAAVQELESEYGPFPVRKPKRKKKKSSKRGRETEEEGELQEEEDLQKRKREMSDSSTKRKTKKSRLESEEERAKKRSDRETKKKEKAKEKARKKKKRKQKADLARLEKKRRKLRKQQELDEPIVTSLRALDWLWRDRTQQYRETEEKLETEREYYARQSIELHPQFVKAGIVHQLPRLHTLAREHEYPNDTPGRVYDPPRQRHSDRQYAQFCGRLVNCLQGQARLFATCEFFYSSIDRPWYNQNPFASAAAELGIPKGAKLTRREWAAVRRRMPKKPRRFSEKFIVSQLSDRNEYRSKVRKLQNNPHLSSTENFPFVVPAPIRPGTMVTAYSKRFRIIQRGRVLTYDRKTALYLVEFENGQFGYELCPDSDVATSGVPTVLFAPSNHYYRGDDDNGLTAYLPGSLTGPMPDVGSISARSISATDGLAQSLGFTPFGHGSEKPENSRDDLRGNDSYSASTVNNGAPRDDDSLLEVVAEHDAFVTLMEVVDAARSRKLELLGLIEDASALMVNRLPFGDGGGGNTELSPEAKEHLGWLRANLVQTEQVLSSASDYLRMLYGNAYRPSQSITKPSSEREQRLNLLQATIAARPNQTSALSKNWATKLISHADDVSGTLAWSVGQPVSKKQRGQQSDMVHIDSLWIDIKHRVAAAGQLACTASYVQNNAANGGPAGPDSAIALDAAHEKLIHSFEFPESTDETPNGRLYNEVLSARASAKEDLEDALTLLKTELELSHLKQTVKNAAAADQ